MGSSGRPGDAIAVGAAVRPGVRDVRAGGSVVPGRPTGRREPRAGWRGPMAGTRLYLQHTLAATG